MYVNLLNWPVSMQSNYISLLLTRDNQPVNTGLATVEHPSYITTALCCGYSRRNLLCIKFCFVLRVLEQVTKYIIRIAAITIARDN